MLFSRGLEARHCMAPYSDVTEAATDVCLLERSEVRLNLKAVSLSASTNSPESMTPIEIFPEESRRSTPQDRRKPSTRMPNIGCKSIVRIGSSLTTHRVKGTDRS